MTITSAIYLYAAIGVSIFLLLVYAIDTEKPQPGWWKDRSYLIVSALCVVVWPLILYLWVRKNIRQGA